MCQWRNQISSMSIHDKRDPATGVSMHKRSSICIVSVASLHNMTSINAAHFNSRDNEMITKDKNKNHIDTRASKYSLTIPQYRTGSALICPT